MSRIDQELAMGIAEEMEHTDDPRIARRIALDHLRERPDYYSQLARCFPKTNPYRTEHAARQRSPRGYKSCGRVTIYHGRKPIGLVTCSPTGRRSSHDTEVQSIRFPVDHWTLREARTWLRDHGYDDSRIEPARDHDPG